MLDNLRPIAIYGGGSTISHLQRLAAHEALEVHEAINFKTLCLASSKFTQGLVFDLELRALMDKDVRQSIDALAELQSLYARAPFAAPVPETRPTPILN